MKRNFAELEQYKIQMEQYQALQSEAITREDYAKANNYLHELANEGNVYAMCEFGLYYINGVNLLKSDMNLAKSWLKKAAEKGHPRALYEYAYMVRSTYCDQTELFKHAFETNDPYVLGEMYRHGIYVEENQSLSIEYYLKAGCFRAFDALGDIYYKNGDLSKSFEYHLKSAEMGYAHAQCYVGYWYEIGRGINKDLMKAYNWYEKAANQDYKIAIDQLKCLQSFAKN